MAILRPSRPSRMVPSRTRFPMMIWHRYMPESLFAVLSFWVRMNGYVMFLVAGGLADMLSIGTAPGARRRGSASRLLRESLRRLANESVDRVMLEVAVDNLAAKALYTGLGFCEVGRREGYYRRQDGRVDAIVMSRQPHDEGSS